jgi:hypothetical protein
MWRLWPQDEGQALYYSNISHILYISDSSDRPVTKLTNGLAAAQFSLELRDVYLLPKSTDSPPFPPKLIFCRYRVSSLGFRSARA